MPIERVGEGKCGGSGSVGKELEGRYGELKVRCEEWEVGGRE